MCDGNGPDDDQPADEPPSDDQVLLEQCRAGQRAALTRVYELHAPSVYRFFSNKVRPEDIEDLYQETMERLFAKLGELDPTCARDPKRLIRAYVLGIARYVLIEYLRKEARTQTIDIETVPLAAVVPGAGSSVAAHLQRLSMLLQALREIPIAYQILFELHYFEEWSINQIANAYLGIPSSTARNHMQRARELVRDRLAAMESRPRSSNSGRRF